MGNQCDSSQPLEVVVDVIVVVAHEVGWLNLDINVIAELR